METPISVEALLAQAQRYDGQPVAVEGQFIAMFSKAFISAPRESLELTPERPRIRLEYPNIEDRCFQVVSAYVGGPWYYNDPAVVRGRFLAGPEPRLVELSELIIRRPDAEHRVAL
ncbi:hypothetical protein FJV41_00380 [Myxococcus llanfairpwllgwyngyllgogerychwyrndrobwllllantysiliogogogochensis]|uniref:Uncharacterized protein n=1 Tax=Myxococcus llanfairpwllgwyngyllgogerychwyrndrobwllllantysiliogogogochensis TaxID=2590453 RepID=A0A540X9U8_9BACT|nr:hypothetical protein [Myxococcus llanfairpwllgwyngyllgogerychwyrndrobwllllantysiliogogogochensis]TQF18037.1 hypothetical protein FJV41_00380 [Myxococcus llanfairpwllgwyngyllgogerychwyrndrobwllllantysiliogogogochensis]